MDVEQTVDALVLALKINEELSQLKDQFEKMLIISKEIGDLLDGMLSSITDTLEEVTGI